MLEGVSFGPWVRSPRLSVRHRVDGGEPVVSRRDGDRWGADLCGALTWASRGGAERAVDRALAGQGASLGTRVPMDGHLSFRVSEDMLSRWKRAATGGDLSDWIRGVLNAASGDADAGTPAEVVE